MKSFLTNWKTTLGGLATVFGGLATIAHALTASPPDVSSLMGAGTAIAGGVALIFAKDGNVTGGTTKQ